MAPALDGFFVMAYDMNSKTQPSATSPLFGSALQRRGGIEQFCKVVPPSKVDPRAALLRVRLAHRRRHLRRRRPRARSLRCSYATIAAAGHPTYWDPATDTPWTAYQVGTQWHRTYFDDPTSMALKAQLANFFHIAGVGIWALGHGQQRPGDDRRPAGQRTGRQGHADRPAGPAGTGFETLASYDGVNNIALTPVAAATTAAGCSSSGSWRHSAPPIRP